MAAEVDPQRRFRIVRRVAAALSIVALPPLIVVGCLTLALDGLFESDPSGCRDSDVDLVRDAAHGDVEAVDRALRGGKDPDAVDGHGNSALSCAGPAGEREVVRLLLDAGADVEATSRYGESLVLDAAEHCRPNVLEELLAHGGDRLPLDEPLALAADHADVASVRLLLDAGADASAWGGGWSVHVREGSGCVRSGSLERELVLRTMLEHGGRPDVVLREAVDLGLAPLVADALERGADPDPSVPDLEDAAVAEVVGSDPALASIAADSPLLFALYFGGELPRSAPLAVALRREDQAMVRALLAAGADPDRTWVLETASCDPAPSDGCRGLDLLLAEAGDGPPLEYAYVERPPLLVPAWRGNLELVQLLLDAGADPSGSTPGGVGALHAAAAGGHAAIVDLLLASGAQVDPGVRPSPAEVAARAGFPELAARPELGGPVDVPIPTTTPTTVHQTTSGPVVP